MNQLAKMLNTLHNCRFAGGISASGQTAGFGGNLFTRDTLRVLRDMMHVPDWQPVIRELLVTLLQWQGDDTVPETNEFPGALQHQVFRQVIGGLYMPDEQVETAKHWTGVWGVPMTSSPQFGEQFVIYNSSDGPPLYLITLAEYCQRHGTNILGDRFVHWPSGETRTVGEAVLRLVQYLMTVLDERDQDWIGLYAVPNTNPKQTSPSGVMRDGWDAYLRPPIKKGGQPEPADYSMMAYVENQALVYEALAYSAPLLFPTHDAVDEWKEAARCLRERTFELMWLEEERFFAAAYDHDGPVPLISSAAFELLNGPFFEGLADAPDYVETLSLRMFSAEFLTPIGLRMTSHRHRDMEGEEYCAYQGSRAVWGVTNGIVTTGLERWGLHGAANDLGVRMLQWFEADGTAREMTFVDDNNWPVLHPDQQTKIRDGQRLILCPSEIGQPDQAWSASAAVRRITGRQRYEEPRSGSWQGKLARDLRALASDVRAVGEHIYSPLHFLNTVRGRQLQEERAARLGLSA